jgi:hypothetical protein
MTAMCNGVTAAVIAGGCRLFANNHISVTEDVWRCMRSMRAQKSMVCVHESTSTRHLPTSDSLADAWVNMTKGKSCKDRGPALLNFIRTK